MSNKIIFAYDSVNPDLLDQLSGSIERIKIGLPVILSEGLGIIKQIKSLGFSTLVDVKLADVEHINQAVQKLLLDSGADAIIAHGFMPIKPIPNQETFIVVSMTHSNKIFKPNRLIRQNLEADGFVVAAQDIRVIQQIKRTLGDKKVLCPGISSLEDAKTAVEAGADFVIVGRLISNATDPLAMVGELSDSIN